MKKNYINNFLLKLDKKLFKETEKIVLEDVRKSKNRKHKYWVFVGYSKWNLVASTIILLIVVPIGQSYFYHISIGIIIFVVNCFLVSIFYHSYRSSVRMAESYDWLYEHRKIPEVYDIMKRDGERLFEEVKSSRIRGLVFSSAFDILFVIVFLLDMVDGQFFLAINMLYLILHSLVLNNIGNYLFYIFDFEPPDPKKKKEKKKALTALMAEQFRRAIERIKTSSSIS